MPYPNPAPPHRERVAVLDALRGVAALAVVCFHFTIVIESFLPPGPLETVCSWGKHGVEVFFAISGFVIPWSMHVSGYRVRDFGRFLGRRFLRLHPPYLATMAATIALAWVLALVPGFHGGPPRYTASQLFAHLVFLNDLLGLPWVVLIFWTLAIELQFYLLMGLLFPAFAARPPWIRAVLFGALGAAAGFLPQRALIFHFLPAFLLGTLVFQRKIGVLRRGEFAAWFVALAGLLAWQRGWPPAFAAIACASCIALWPHATWRPLAWLGTVSYSLYLIHYPVGIHLLNVSLRFQPGPPGKALVFAVALTAALFAAWLLYLVAERPAIRWSARFRRAATAAPPRETTQSSTLR